MVVKLGGTALCRQCFKKMLDSGSIALENGEKRSRTAPNSKRPSKFVKAMVLKGGHRFSGYNNVAQLCKQYEMPEMDIEEVDMDDVDNDRESARQVRESVKSADSISMTKTELKNFVSATTSRRGSTASSAASNPVGNMDAAVMSSMDEADGEGSDDELFNSMWSVAKIRAVKGEKEDWRTRHVHHGAIDEAAPVGANGSSLSYKFDNFVGGAQPECEDAEASLDFITECSSWGDGVTDSESD